MKISSIKFKINSYFNKGGERSIAVKKNIAASLVLKCISILVSLQVVPLTIDYINPTKYGIWLTLSSIIAWLSYFDLGFAHGFRNRFAEAKAKGDTKLAKEYVSTTYAVLFLLFSVILLITLIVNKYLNWSSILNIDAIYNEELHIVFGLLACFFCLNIIASVFTTMLMADQKPALASLIQTGGQVLAFVCIYVLTKTTTGSLGALAIAFAGVPCFLLIVVSFAVFKEKKYKSVAPMIQCIRFSLTKKILGMGGQFFIVMIAMLFIFQFINIILSRLEGSETVTQYNIAYKYFSVLHMFAMIVLTPFWSAFTDAYAKQDYDWMKRMIEKLEKMWLLCIPLALAMLILSDFVYSFWIGDSLKIDFSLSLIVALYMLVQILGGVYMYMINGIGKIRIQVIIYLAFTPIALPIMYLLCRDFGMIGILFVPIIVYLCQALVARIQIRKIVRGTARGLWDK